MAPETQSEARLRGLEIKLESTLVEMRSTNGKLDRIAESIERHIDETDGHFHKIDAALRAWSAGDYGLCRVCDGDIGYGRLKARPEAPRCLEC